MNELSNETAPSRRPILEQFQPHELSVLLGYTEERFIQSGTLLFRQGDHGDGCYFVKQGKVRVELNLGEQSEKILLGYISNELSRPIGRTWINNYQL